LNVQNVKPPSKKKFQNFGWEWHLALYILSDFSGIKNLSGLNDLNSLSGLNDLYSLISSKNLYICCLLHFITWERPLKVILNQFTLLVWFTYQHQKNKNWWIRHKCSSIINMKDPKYQQKSIPICSPEQNYLFIFAMRYPVGEQLMIYLPSTLHWCEKHFSEKSDISENSSQDCVKVGQSYICSPSPGPAASRFELNWRRYIFFFFCKCSR
jgi:hypothetical protein